MTDRYHTILNPGQDELTEKKSRFIGYAMPVESEEAAYALVEAIKKKHYDARHHCYAFAVGTEPTLYRFSDDGEPQGTAGKPILEVMTGREVVNACIVVTRYFGGTLLGTGGLVRAYTEAARLALANAGICVMQHVKLVDITANYNDAGKIQYFLNSGQIRITSADYTNEVVFHTMIPPDAVSYIEKKIMDMTAARAAVTIAGEAYCRQDQK